MKIKRTELVTACALVRETIPRKEVKPVLANFKITPSGDYVYLEGTDCEMALSIRVGLLEPETKSWQLVSADGLASAVKVLSDSECELVFQDRETVLSGSSAEFRLPTFTTRTEYPEWPLVADHTPAWEVPAGILAAMISRTIYTVSVGKGGSVLMGLCFDFQEEAVTVVGCDGRHLAQITLVQSRIARPRLERPVVPHKTVSLLRNVLRRCQPEEIISVRFRDNDVVFKADSFQVWSVLIAGQFPNYVSIVSHPYRYRATLNPRDLQQCIKQAGVMADEMTMRMEMTLASGQITLSCQGRGKSRSRMALLTQQGHEPITVYVNQSLVPQMLSACPFDGDIELCYGNRDEPLFVNATFLDVDKDIPLQFRYMLMPLGEAKK